jgi:hypothetical protein
MLQSTASLGIFRLGSASAAASSPSPKNLNASASATFTNVAFYDASKNPGSVPGERFYTGLVDSFATWMQS